ncbi:integrase [Catenuloplanes nepalensis]|uniref:Integrase n=1 Tax=Catenuloplanes nepalensis TaxID=587533 RepID=A0ABT9N5N8_9ACTN|nr:tyrosine-type recombinase/integrase [Catenuloplanes nepalensis]MDP9799029.1 integrase [Catenuloplanes nepalensis]
MPAKKRDRGSIETLPSGSLRVKVYAGIDPITKRRYDLTETIPPGPRADREAQKALTKLLRQLDEQRNPRTRATVNQLVDRYLEVLRVEGTTRPTYEGYIKNHIRPLLGEFPIARLGGEIFDSFYAELRKCRAHCRGRKYVEHRTDRAHACDHRCGPHVCRPLADSTIKQINGILSGACSRAVRWGWLGTNPMDQAERLPAGRPDPHPPTPEQAARITMEAWADPDWGMFVWLAFVTGARRGELCALTWDRIDFSTGVLTIRSSIAQHGAKTWEKHTKTHQQRRIVLDDQTLALLRAYRRLCVERAAELGTELVADARIFSGSPDGRTWLKPDTATQRFGRMGARISLDVNLHQLRHYTATELIAAGVDVRTVAGRLGHGGGGTTTLRVYSAWLSEADQRAAGTLAGRMPELPAGVAVDERLASPDRPVTEDSAPYHRIAADLRAAVRCGALRPGDPLPVVTELAGRYGVAASTAHRAVALLAEADEVIVRRGKRAIVAGAQG